VLWAVPWAVSSVGQWADLSAYCLAVQLAVKRVDPKVALWVALWVVLMADQ